MSYIKIYFDDKPVYLIDDLTQSIAEVKEQKDTIYMEGLSNYYLQSMPREIKKPDYKQGMIFHENLAELRDKFFEQFELITAAGGLVSNEKNEILMILRRSKWDLPKGKLDPGETIEECALREVREETGLKNLVLGNKVGTTFHTYTERGTMILKQSHWFAMQATSDEILLPQTAEEITEAKWVDKEEMEECKKNSFATIVEMLEIYKGL